MSMLFVVIGTCITIALCAIVAELRRLCDILEEYLRW